MFFTILVQLPFKSWQSENVLPFLYYHFLDGNVQPGSLNKEWWVRLWSAALSRIGFALIPGWKDTSRCSCGATLMKGSKGGLWCQIEGKWKKNLQKFSWSGHVEAWKFRFLQNRLLSGLLTGIGDKSPCSWLLRWCFRLAHIGHGADRRYIFCGYIHLYLVERYQWFREFGKILCINSEIQSGTVAQRTHWHQRMHRDRVNLADVFYYYLWCQCVLWSCGMATARFTRSRLGV